MDKDENILTSEQTSDNEDSAFSEQEKTKHNSEWSAGQKQLKSHRSLIAPLLKSNSVPAPVSFDEYRQVKNDFKFNLTIFIFYTQKKTVSFHLNKTS